MEFKSTFERAELKTQKIKSDVEDKHTRILPQRKMTKRGKIWKEGIISMDDKSNLFMND